MDESTADDRNRQRLAQQYQRWRQAQLPSPETLTRLRTEAQAAAEATQGPTREWIARTYGLLAPNYLFTFWAFWLGLSPVERQAVVRFVRPAGLFTYCDEAGRARIPREGLDHRLAWRYYLDPPEFVTVLTGNMDGLHYGLWYDAPDAAPAFVAGYYAGDADAIHCKGRTLLEVLCATVERAARDYYPPTTASEAEADLFPKWLVRDAIAEYEAEDLQACGNTPLAAFCDELSQRRLATYSEIGAVVPAMYDTFMPHPSEVVYDAIDHDAPVLSAWIAEAERACDNGQPAFALVLGHDFHWRSAGRPQREEAAWRLLTRAYGVLGYDALAAVATLHHRHRHLRSVEIY